MPATPIAIFPSGASDAAFPPQPLAPVLPPAVHVAPAAVPDAAEQEDRYRQQEEKPDPPVGMSVVVVVLLLVSMSQWLLRVCPQVILELDFKAM